MEANDFFRGFLNGKTGVQSSYFDKWNQIKSNYEEKRQQYLENATFSDFTVFEEVQKTIPRGYQIHLSNSSTVRYAQLFPLHESLKVFCNRGTSGIDGSTSTAIGSSIHCNHPTLLISGDLSFLYDSNALWNQYIRNDFRIILINNSGGGIFRILPGFDSSERFATFFETQHQLTAENLCEQYRFEYSTANSMDSLKMELSNFFEGTEKPKLLEIFTPTEVNNEILLGYFDFISSEYR